MHIETLLTTRLGLFALALVSTLFFLTTNLPWQLDDYDQAQQAFTSYEMIHEGHWFYQRTPHELIAQKPPLVGWVSAGLYSVSRSWDIAWRLPSLIAAAGLAVGIYYTANLVYGELPAFVAGSAFCLNLLTVRLATLVRTDMPLALTIFAAGAMILVKIGKAEPWRVREQLLFVVILAGSMWIKGPFVFIFLAPALVIFWLWRRRDSGASALPAWWTWLASFALFLPWIVGGLRLFPTFYQQVIAFEVVNRLSEVVHRPQPIYFYTAHLLHKFAPWSLLMIGLAVVAVRIGERSAPRKISAPTAWLVCWSFAGLVIMSVVPSKRVDRVYAAIPPLCLLLSAQVAAVLAGGENRRSFLRWISIAFVAAVLFTGAYTSWKIGFGYYNHLDALETFGKQVRSAARHSGWRYEVVSGLSGSEGMLLYLERPYFIEVADAVRKWNAGEIDALAIPSDVRDELVPQLHPAPVSQFRSTHRQSQPRVDYELFVRDGSMPAHDQ